MTAENECDGGDDPLPQKIIMQHNLVLLVHELDERKKLPSPSDAYCGN